MAAQVSPTGVRFSESQKRWLGKKAEKQSQTISEVVRNIVADEIAGNDLEHRIRVAIEELLQQTERRVSESVNHAIGFAIEKHAEEFKIKPMNFSPPAEAWAPPPRYRSTEPTLPTPPPAPTVSPRENPPAEPTAQARPTHPPRRRTPEDYTDAGMMLGSYKADITPEVEAIAKAIRNRRSSLPEAKILLVALRTNADMDRMTPEQMKAVDAQAEREGNDDFLWKKWLGASHG